MAGRGRGRYGERDGPLRRPGEPVASPPPSGNVNTATLIEKISDINVLDIDPLLLHETEIMFKRLFATGEDVKDVLSNLHSQAVNDSDFGEKLVVALEQVCTFEVDNVCVRSQWLTYIQKDHSLKETMSRSESQKFANAITLLGSVYNVFKIGGEPIRVLGHALLDYFDLIVKNCDEALFQVLTTQVILNGYQIKKSEDTAKRFESLKHSLRKSLLAINLSNKAKCWILLAVDYLNDLKAPTGVVRDFYIENMGDDYVHLEARLKGTVSAVNSPRHQTSHSSKSETESVKLHKCEGPFEVVSDMNISNQVSKGRSITKSRKPEQELFSSRRGRYEEAEMRAKKEGLESKISIEKHKSPKSDDDFYGIQIHKKVDDKR